MLLSIKQKFGRQLVLIAGSHTLINLHFKFVLNLPKVLIDSVFQDFAKQKDLSVFLAVYFYSLNNGSCPIDDQLFEAISLVKEREHIVLHCLTRLSIRDALDVILLFG